MIRAVPQPRRFAQRMAGLEPADVVARVWAGDRFAAIPDPGRPLAQLACQHRFRRIFPIQRSGGRYVALSLVDLVPAAALARGAPADGKRRVGR